MKNTIDDLDKTYKLCTSTGSIKEKSVDIELIKSLKIVAERGLNSSTAGQKTFLRTAPIGLLSSETIMNH